ncbi:hypothetical protein DJ018_09125 [Phenylobacterium deserti]|uniref:histidine kinase n=1 Tax=Phenylobacterium deserti TaxID=1914756 RepID=A0A328ASJ8_9CAUL|nr:HWE histidine kinase domain-containing protein [Phenylobacterium deserti]RAK58052.1 hypothetical protein DJ018_09125 [Phenylobacterium deserti]
MIVLPSLVRAVLAPMLGETAPFASYFPAVLVASVFAGWRAGLAVTVGAAAVANYFFIAPFGELSLSLTNVAATALFLVTTLLIIVVASNLRQTVSELDRTVRREESLRVELAHRVKNNLAVVQGLARQTSRLSSDPEAFYHALSGRLMALGQAHNILSTGEWEACEVSVLVREALGPFQSEGSVAFHGEACLIPPDSCVPLVLALHELATNAVKYGALSEPNGRVDVDWRIEPADGNRLLLQWRESGGPIVQPPQRRGLGSRLLRPQPGLDDARLAFDPDGVRCEFEIGGATRLPA